MKYILTILFILQFANSEAQIRKHPVRLVSYSPGSVTVYQNLFTWSEDITNANWNNSGNCVVTSNSGTDLTGGNTMNEINCTFGASNTLGQTISVIAGDSVYLEFDVYKPASGAVTDVYYQFYDLSNFTNLVNASYFSTVTTSVQRLRFGILVPVGCTSLICRPFGDNSTTGKILIGRCQIKKVWSNSYITTTTTPYL